jgi:hypothetical protein
MNNLAQSIENLYLTFGVYNTQGMEYCNCGCIKEENVKKLYSKPLHQLEGNDLVSYNGSALYTWGELEHYKHFLPRILELHSQKREFATISLFDINYKLEYAEFHNWPLNEQKAIKDFILNDWIEFANYRNSEITETQIEEYAKFFKVEDLINYWHFDEIDLSLYNFVYFFYYHGYQVLNGGLRINKQKHDKEFIEKLSNKKLIQKLETAFFENETLDTDYAEKISIVLQMIEQEMKLIK